MFNKDGQTKAIIATCLVTWLISFGSAWMAYSNTITEMKTNQMMLIEDNKTLHNKLNIIEEKVEKNTREGAVTNSVINRLNLTLTKIDTSLDKIVRVTTVNTVRLDALLKQEK
jgi:hypothetical protein